MNFRHAAIYRMSDYPERPNVIVLAQVPFVQDELRDHLTELRDVTFAGQEVTLMIHIENDATGEYISMDPIAPDVPVHEIDFSAYVKDAGVVPAPVAGIRPVARGWFLPPAGTWAQGPGLRSLDVWG